MDNCNNYAHISGNVKYVGGFIGCANGSTSRTTLDMNRCINYGSIECSSRVGGLVGYAEAFIRNDAIKILNCVNHGEVSANNGFQGGLLGELYKVGIAVYNSYSTMEFGHNLIGYNDQSVVKLDNVYIYSSVDREQVRILGDVSGDGSITYNNVYCPNQSDLSSGIKHYDANWNVVEMSPAKSLVDALNEVTLPEGCIKEPWVIQNGRPVLEMELNPLPLPGTGNQNEGYGEIGGVEWN